MKKTVIFLLLCLFLTGCAAEEAEHSLIANLNLFSPYAETVLQTVPDYELRAQTDGLYTELSQGNAAACFDAAHRQALSRTAAIF